MPMASTSRSTGDKRSILSTTTINKKERCMGRSVNKVILLGRAGKDPSVHILRTGTIVNLSLATSERYRDIHGDWQEHTEWHNLVGYQRVGEILRDYVRKGSRLDIE